MVFPNSQLELGLEIQQMNERYHLFLFVAAILYECYCANDITLQSITEIHIAFSYLSCSKVDGWDR